MSPRLEVPPLKYISLKLLAAQVIVALSDESGTHYRTVEAYLQDVTSEVLQDLLKVILDSLSLDAGTRYSCLEILMRSDVQVVETGIFPYSYYEKILKVISEKGGGLQQISLKGVWARDFPDLLVCMIEKLKSLRVLAMPHIGSDQVLEAITKCDRLTALDISGECNFSEDGLRQLKVTTLRLLDIGSYGERSLCVNSQSDPSTVLAEVIKNNPNLVVLRTYNFTGQALLFLHQGDCEFKTNLRYLRDTRTTKEACEAIVATCPDLESIYLNSPEQETFGVLKRVRSLSSLKLTKFDCKTLMEYLEGSGSQLRTLKLNHSSEGSLDLSKLPLLTPQLFNLECFKVKLAWGDPDAFFVSLQSVEILYCDILDSVVKFVLTNCPFLRRIILGNAIQMTDGDLFRLCAESDFVALEELWFSCAKCLTVTSAVLLMGHCPNLKSLGQLSGWDVSAEDIEYLQAIVFATNLNLTLLPTNQ